MPEISRFFGIVIRMFVEASVPHQRPHFHAYYQDRVAVYAVDTIELLTGEFPSRQARLTEAWAELHQAELLAAWSELQAGRLPGKIEPLR